ncbi:hypothetical protein [Mesorhizobium sp.]|uniref:hypothetical protein n=1 Tax=Mesorhizobium sp. TaxID=1871066 RepID=UPI000FE8A320|nr:hypothetical protein [Mesorhizobium sp.]RWE61124.1 MAG: hypothetical protein EOS67_05245 [Mesorhizobium sp.]
MTDYMGSVDRARASMYRGDNSLIRHLQGNSASWRGFHAGLHPFFSSDIARSLGLALARMKPFCAGGFLSAFGSFKRFPSGRRQAWFVTTEFHTQSPPPAVAESSRHRACRRGNVRSDLQTPIMEA